ncbi:MAG: peroxiredoxin [Methanomicrobiales archaeon]|nr:peroxiredoxin [Methanomicrobiales archaeon]
MIGEEAPPFCLPDTDETEICLEKFRGNWVILYFYPRDNTPGCTLEAIQFNRELENFAQSGAVIIGVSPDTPESHRKFRERHGLHLVLLSDAEHHVLTAYRVWRPKVLFGKELLGVERSTFLIDPQGTIVEVWRKVRVTGHATEVLSSLEKHQGDNKSS